MSGSQGHAVIWIIPTEEQWVRETKHEGGCAVQFHWHHTKFTYRQSPSEKVAGRIAVPSGHFPGGSDGKAPAYSAGDSDPWSGKIPCAAKRLGPCATAAEPVLWSPQAATAQPVCCNFGLQLLMPACPGVCAPLQQKPPQWETYVPDGRVAPLATTKEKPVRQWRPSTTKKKINRWWHLPGEEDWCRVEQSLVTKLC